MISDDEKRRILKAIAGFCRAMRLTEAQQIVEAHPELLTEAADELMAQLESGSQQKEFVRERWALLRSCRELGIQEAFASRAESEAFVPQEFRLFKALFPEDWEETWGYVMRKLEFPSNQREFDEALARHPELQALFTQTLEDTVVVRAALKLFAAKEWSAKKRIVQQYPQLLGEVAEEFLSDLGEDAKEDGNTELGQRVADALHILRRCRQIGIEAAFAEQGTRGAKPV
jgi:hypothetical protein